MKILLLLLLSFPVFADVANIDITAPKFRSDNITPMTAAELKEYIILVDGIENIIPVNTSGPLSTYTFSPTKAVVISVIAIDLQGRISAPSTPFTVFGSLGPGVPIVTYTLTIDVSGNITVTPQ